MSALVPTSPALPTVVSSLDEAARRYAGLAPAPRTREAYERAWRSFAAWPGATFPTPPATLASYIAHLADRGVAPASIDLALAAISVAHTLANFPSPRSAPEVRLVRKGLRRARGTAQRQAAALAPAELAAIVGALPDDIHGLRDRALILLGFAAALRRSELVALNVEDLRFTADGLEVTVRRSKTDQGGKGRVVGVHRGGRALTCPVRAAQAWIDVLQVLKLKTGALFRGFAGRGSSRLTERLSDRDVARILQRAARTAGVDASRLSGHSLRAGFATAAARAGERFARNPLAGVL